MWAARALSLVYVAFATAFAFAIALQQHPEWTRAAVAMGQSSARVAEAQVLHPAAIASKRELVAFFDAIDPPVPTVTRAMPRLARSSSLRNVERQQIAASGPPATARVQGVLQIPGSSAPKPDVFTWDRSKPFLYRDTSPDVRGPKFAIALPPSLSTSPAQTPVQTAPHPAAATPPPTLGTNDSVNNTFVPGLLASSWMPAGTPTKAAPPGFISFCSRFLDQCIGSSNGARIVHLDLLAQAALKTVTRSVNREIFPEDDGPHYGRAEYWDIPTDGYGNCKDYALTKRKRLIDAGFPERALRLAIVVTPRENRHVVLTVATDRGDLVLDNLNNDVKPWIEVGYRWLERQDASGGLGWVTFPADVDIAAAALATPVPTPPPPVQLALAAPPPAPEAVRPSPSPAPIKPLSRPSQQPAPLAPSELNRVLVRMKENLTPELLASFELFLYVSKADHGPWAQHMYVFEKSARGDLNLAYNWPVSTGREQVEFNKAGIRLPTRTPPGYYELDSTRFYRHYTSLQWAQAMPYAMFFNWLHDGAETGLAIHAATGDDIGVLGKRASAGCIRLAPENARLLFGLIKSRYRGLAPRFAVDRRTGTMSNDGILLHDTSGRVAFAPGYKVLVFIENYGGDENVVAALF